MASWPHNFSLELFGSVPVGKTLWWREYAEEKADENMVTRKQILQN